jgi:hypothetical protein
VLFIEQQCGTRGSFLFAFEGTLKLALALGIHLGGIMPNGRGR